MSINMSANDVEIGELIAKPSTPFYSLIHRLVTLPLSKEDYKKERNIIKQVAVE
jgi:hypothetical protein